MHSANSNPPPKAILLTAEIVGMGRVDKREKVERRDFKKFLVLQIVSHLIHIHISFLQAYLLILSEAQSLLQIRTRTECIVTLTGEDQGTGAALLSLGMQLLYDSAQLSQQLGGNGIAGFGTVQREDGDFTGMRSGDVGEADGGGEGARGGAGIAGGGCLFQ